MKAHEITTKFAIATEQGIDTLLPLMRQGFREKYNTKLKQEELDSHIKAQFTREILTTEMNSFSNQYIIVYADNQPAGYAVLTSKGNRPAIFGHKTMVRIAELSVLERFDDEQIKKTLLQKCISISSMQQVIWITSEHDSPEVKLYESFGFAPFSTGGSQIELIREKAA